MSPPPSVTTTTTVSLAIPQSSTSSLSSSSLSSSPSCLIPPPSKSSPRNRSSSLTICSVAPPANGLKVSMAKHSIRSPSGPVKQLTPSSSPEPGSSPRALAVAGWQSLLDENSELRTMAGEEGIRLIEDEYDEEDGDESEEEEADVFAITESQKEYYVKQFLSVQPDITGRVTGPVVKAFFEKSALSTTDLSHIWHLSDYDNEGCLNVDKWCVAMHLTILRRNQVDLPSTLPASLFATAVPGQKPIRRHTSSDVSQQIITFHQDPLLTNTTGSQSDKGSSLIPLLHATASSSSSLLLIPSLSSCDPPHEPGTAGVTSSNTWTKFSDSPTSVEAVSHDLHSLQLMPTDVANQPSSSGYLTAGNHSHHPCKQPNQLPQQQQLQLQQLAPQQQQQYHSLDPLFLNQQTQPANFDFNASSIETDPAILHPIPLRLTPEGKNLLQCLAEHPTSKR